MKPTLTDQASASKLSYFLFKRENLSPGTLHEMYALMEDSYAGTRKTLFLQDLQNKDYVALMTDESGRIQGFTTYLFEPWKHDGQNFYILFSGDTIISPAHWGTLALVKGFCKTSGFLLKECSGADLYWILLSKGHRTYQYLPLFFRWFYPCYDSSRQAPLEPLLNVIAWKLFGDCWKPDKGLVIFKSNQYHLKPELSEAALQRQTNPNIQFFLQKNPRYSQGQELACIARIHPDNMLRSARKYMLEGFAAAPESIWTS